jgi:hypothetical protein
MSLINDLWDTIERNPPAIQARELLLQQWISAGWLDAAADTARELLRLDPSNVVAKAYLQKSQCERTAPASSGRPAANTSASQGYAKPQLQHLPKRADDRAVTEVDLSEGLKAIRAHANILIQEMRLVRDLSGNLPHEEAVTPGSDRQGVIQNLKALSDGRVSAVVSGRPPPSARAIARAMEGNRDHALDVVIDDLADVVRWLRSSSEKPIDNDSVRETLAKRIRVLVAALPDDLQQHPSTALTHIEHEELGRTYVNSETMYGDPIADIPRANFWTSQDGYAWDMEELATCFASHSGVMRNPLSRQMFPPDDIRAIVQHPLGRGLAALNMKQSQLSNGVRKATIDQLDQLSAALLADQSSDQMASRHALDAFLAYTATLPQAEQNAIDELQVPATDSHTGQAFDCTIGEAVRDAQANKVCLHKTGDFIGQAAKHLRQPQAAV